MAAQRDTELADEQVVQLRDQVAAGRRPRVRVSGPQFPTGTIGTVLAVGDPAPTAATSSRCGSRSPASPTSWASPRGSCRWSAGAAARHLPRHRPASARRHRRGPAPRKGCRWRRLLGHPVHGAPAALGYRRPGGHHRTPPPSEVPPAASAGQDTRWVPPAGSAYTRRDYHHRLRGVVVVAHGTPARGWS